MTANEDVRKLHAQILNLRSAAIACAKAIHLCPPCGKTERCKFQCPEGWLQVEQMLDSLNRAFLSATMTLDAVLHPDPERWDILWHGYTSKGGRSVESVLAQLLPSVSHILDHFIQLWGEADDDFKKQLETTFHDEEWKILTAKGAWQNGSRLAQIVELLEYLELHVYEKTGLLFESILCGELSGDCKLHDAGKLNKAPSLL